MLFLFFVICSICLCRFCNAYTVVSYLNESFSGFFTSPWEKELIVLISITRYFLFERVSASFWCHVATAFYIMALPGSISRIMKTCPCNIQQRFTAFKKR